MNVILIKKYLKELVDCYKAIGFDAFYEKYGIKVKRDENFILFDYDMLNVNWDFKPSILCRGLILDAKTLKPACFPLLKFWNSAEGYADIIDWETAKVVEKADGTMVCRWWNKYEKVFSYTTRRQLPGDIKRNTIQDSKITWYKLINKCLEKPLQDIIQRKNKTLVFEVMSPANRVVVIHKEYHANLIAERDNDTYHEHDVLNNNWAPKTFSLSSTKECKKFVNTLSGLKSEGVIVCDAAFNRVKIKSKDYLALHHLKDSTGNSLKSLILVVRRGEWSEIATAFPEFISAMKKIEIIINDWEEKHQVAYNKYKNINTQKDFALAIQKENILTPSLLFFTRSSKANSIKDAIKQMDDSKFIKVIKPLVEKAGISIISLEK